MDDFVIRWLRWVVDFVQNDLSKLSRKGTFELFRDLAFFSSEQLFNTSWEPFGKRIEFTQSQFLKWEVAAPLIQKRLRDLLNTMTGTKAAYALPESVSFIRPEGSWRSTDHHVYFKTSFYPEDKTPESWSLWNFARLIHGIEAHVIFRCKNCQRYSLNFSLREKLYCNPKCASRSLARSRKERWGSKKYATYLKKQNRRYEEARKSIGKIVRHRRKESVVKIDGTEA